MTLDSISNEAELSRIIGGYPREKRYILAMMQDLQKTYNYVPRKGMEIIAEHTDTAFSKVYSMATFYKAFSLVPKGRFNIKVCDGTACHIKGSAVIIDQIYSNLGIKPGETTDDGLFSLETVNCLGACALAPVLMVNETVYAQVNSSKIAGIINRCRREKDETSKQS